MGKHRDQHIINNHRLLEFFLSLCAIFALIGCVPCDVNRSKGREDVRAYLVFNEELIPLPLQDEIELLEWLLLAKEDPNPFYLVYNACNRCLSIYPKSCGVIISNTPICPDGMKIDFRSEEFIVVRRWLVGFTDKYLYGNVLSNYIGREISCLRSEICKDGTNPLYDISYLRDIVYDQYIFQSYDTMIDLYYTNDQALVDWFLDIVPQLKWNDEHFGYVVPGYDFKDQE